MNNTLASKKPDALPMWITGLRRVKLNKDGYELAGSKRLSDDMHTFNPTYIYWGTGLPLWRYELRFESGNRFDTLEIRAQSSRAAIKLICERNPNVQGVKEL